ESSADASKPQSAQRHVMLCELGKINIEQLESLLPHSQCLLLERGEQKNIAQRYSNHALACFERIQAIFRSEPQRKVFLQTVVAGEEEEALFAGLSGLLKTASLENFRFRGQLLLVPSDITTEELARQLQAEESGAQDPVVRYQQGTRQALRWQKVAMDAVQ